MQKPLLTCRNQIGRVISLAICVAWLTCLAGTAQAGQPGVKVVRGQVQFTQQGDTLLIQASNRSIISFRSFSVPSGQTVQYVLPSAAARVLTRV